MINNFQASKNVANLNHVPPVLKAEAGEKGYNKDCHGKNADHTIIEVRISLETLDRWETFLLLVAQKLLEF